jgi:hypothetical protein
MDFDRHLSRRLDESLSDTRVVVIAGPRARCGLCATSLTFPHLGSRVSQSR